jgi:hypothetical protein
MPFAPRQHQADPARPPGRFFLKLMPWRSKNRQTDIRAPPFVGAHRADGAGSLPVSGQFLMLLQRRPALTLCWIWLKAADPHQRIAVASPITNCLAAAPPSTTLITRNRRSFEYPIASLLSPRRLQNLIRATMESLRFTENGKCSSS